MHILTPNTVQPGVSRGDEADRRLPRSVYLVKEVDELLEVDFVTRLHACQLDHRAQFFVGDTLSHDLKHFLQVSLTDEALPINELGQTCHLLLPVEHREC